MLKKRDLGSLASKMYNENLVVTVLEKKIYLKGPVYLYRLNFFELPEPLHLTNFVSFRFVSQSRISRFLHDQNQKLKVNGEISSYFDGK